MGVMMFVMGGTFFVLPLYLQIVLGKDPLQTGLHILPLSIAVFCRLAGRGAALEPDRAATA